MRKIFYCYPMSDVSASDRLKNNQRDYELIKLIMKRRYAISEHEYEIIDNFNTKLPDKTDDIKCENLYYLGEGIKNIMSKCDIVIMGSGWANSKGCRCEEYIAHEYGITVIDLEDIKNDKRYNN